MADFDTMWAELAHQSTEDNPLAFKQLPDIKEKDELIQVGPVEPKFRMRCMGRGLS